MKINYRDLENIKIMDFENSISDTDISDLEDVLELLYEKRIYRVVCNLAQVKYISPIAIQCLIKYKKKFFSQGGKIVSCNISSVVMKMLEYSGVNKDFLVKDLNQALNSFSRVTGTHFLDEYNQTEKWSGIFKEKMAFSKRGAETTRKLAATAPDMDRVIGNRAVIDKTIRLNDIDLVVSAKNPSVLDKEDSIPGETIRVSGVYLAKEEEKEKKEKSTYPKKRHSFGSTSRQKIEDTISAHEEEVLKRGGKHSLDDSIFSTPQNLNSSENEPLLCKEEKKSTPGFISQNPLEISFEKKPGISFSESLNPLLSFLGNCKIIFHLNETGYLSLDTLASLRDYSQKFEKQGGKLLICIDPSAIPFSP